MRHRARRLTRLEKIMLWKMGYNSSDFLRIRKTAEGYEFLQLSTGRILPVRG